MSNLKDPSARNIFQSVLNAMQEAEELGGPEGDDYFELMEAICDEARDRIKAYRRMSTHKAANRVSRTATFDEETPVAVSAPAKFDAAFEAAKFARMGAQQGNSRKAALFGLNAMQTFSEAMALVAPTYDDKFAMIAARLGSMRMAVVTDAVRADLLGAGGDEEVMQVFANDEAQQDTQQQKQAGRYGQYTRRRIG